MDASLKESIKAYDPTAPLESASTIPSAWYTDPRFHVLEQRAVFEHHWQVIGRRDQVAEPGRYITAEVAGNPVVAVRGTDGVLRAFFNVCRHHAAAVMCEAEGSCKVMRCPYHAWTYALNGDLQSTPEFGETPQFDKADHGLVPIRVETWENFVLVNVDGSGISLEDYTRDVRGPLADLQIGALNFYDRQTYELQCNWKVYVDNYLDGGYHVPHLHKGLNSALDYSGYTVENGRWHCLQWSPISAEEKNAEFSAVRRGERADYYWIYPNFMINCYEGVMDTNLVTPLGVDRCQVVFDFYFTDVSPEADGHNRNSVEVAHIIQQEDVDICESVQRGLGTRAYDTGRLVPGKEAGEHLFHQLLHADLSRGM